MNTKTLQAVTRHGSALLAAFPNATESDPVALCKKLRRIENVAHRGAIDYCNGTPCHAITGRVFHFGSNETDWEEFTDIIQAKVQRQLGTDADMMRACGFFVNGDARGYALKLCEEWTRKHNNAAQEADTRLNDPDSRPLYIHTDFGSYGILAPDLTA